jgi:prepilin-type N-terminal cleavage/methylation domain-containing protein
MVQLRGVVGLARLAYALYVAGMAGPVLSRVNHLGHPLTHMESVLMTRKRAFTLIEVLVVVGIIALLITIALPSMSEAKRISKRTYCLNNLHECGIAIQSYCQANKEKFPTLCEYLTVELAKPNPKDRRPPISRGLGAELGGKKGKVLECPADLVTEPPADVDSTAGVAVPDVHVGGRYFDVQETSYEGNQYLNDLPRDTKKFKIVSQNALLNGREILMKDVWMLVDFEAFHGPKRLPRCRNYLFPDLRVESEKSSKSQFGGKSATPSPVASNTGGALR